MDGIAYTSCRMLRQGFKDTLIGQEVRGYDVLLFWKALDWRRRAGHYSLC